MTNNGQNIQETKNNEQILHALRERVKELTALHLASTLLQGENSTVEIMKGIADLLPPAWQYPSVTSARLIFDDLSVTTDNFKETEWKQCSEYQIKNGSKGSIEVFYGEQMPDIHEGPFLKEERALIDSLARMIASYFERKSAEENLIRINETLDEQVRQRTIELEKANRELTEQITERINAEKEIRIYQDQLRRLNLELSLSEWREKQTLAADLHDHIGQALAMIKLKLAKLQGNIIFCGYDQNIAEIRELLEQTIYYTRTMTFEICPPLLFELGIIPALEWLAEKMEKKHHLEIRVISSGTPVRLTDELQMLMFRSTRELIINAIKHSGASKAEIMIETEDNALKISVTDNGEGFKPDYHNSGATDMSGFGLFSISERLSCLGGKMTVNGKLEKGAQVILTLPLKYCIHKGETCGG